MVTTIYSPRAGNNGVEKPLHNTKYRISQYISQLLIKSARTA